MTEQLYRADAYLRECAARVLAVNERGGIVLDRTVFYASAGGQPGDKACLEIEGGGSCPIATTVYDADKTTIVHVAAEGAAAARGRPERARRARLGHAQQADAHAHLPAPAVRAGEVSRDRRTGGHRRGPARLRHRGRFRRRQGPADGRAQPNSIAADHPVAERWITDAELEANPGLVRTMAVKPPMGSGRVRLVVIGEDGAVDLQPCGGTHVQPHGEIGRVAVTKIEKKGKLNRRIRVAFA